MQQNALKRAFSLIELSITLAIIAAITIGIIRSQAMFFKARLATAQTLTQNSSVKDISGIMVWYETSLESSFLFDEQIDGGAISVWQDNNPNAASKINAQQSVLANRPVFVENVFDRAIPALRFDGSNDSLPFDASGLINANYTIFVVDKKRSALSGEGVFVGGTGSVAQSNPKIGYASDSSIIIDHYGSSWTASILGASYDSSKAMIHTFSFSSISGVKYWLNGGFSADASSEAYVLPIIGVEGVAIGSYSGSSYLDDDLAEIIIFNRQLQTNERQIVESYLSKKYRITIS